MKKIMGIIIAAGLSASAMAQNYQSQPNVNQSNQFPQNQQNIPQNQQNNMDRNTNTDNSGINNSTYNTTRPGSGVDLQQQQQQQPQTDTRYRNQTDRNYNDINNQSSTKGQMEQRNRTTSPELNNKSTGDSLLRTPPGNPDVTPQNNNSPGINNNRRESGYIPQKENNMLANLPDPKQKSQAKKQAKENRALKERDKTANALPSWVKDNPKLTTVPKEHQCALNDELKGREGAFKDKRSFNGGELAIERERDGDEKVKFDNGTEFYKFERNAKGKEKYTYGVTKDYEQMELRKNDDGTAEVIYRGVFPSVEEAENAIADGIVVDEMGKVCRGVFRE